MFISKPTVVQVGRSKFKISKQDDRPVIQVISKIIVEDPETGEKQELEVPNPGWKAEKI